MSGIDDAVVRDLCRQISQEKDPQEVNQLLASLRSLLKQEQEEARLRMGQIARHYRPRIADGQSDASRPEVLRFRGLRGMLEMGLGLSLSGNSSGSEA